MADIATHSEKGKAVAKKGQTLEQKLLNLADQGLSGQEIGDSLGIPAAEAMMKIRHILEDRDWLSIVERQKLNIMQMSKIKSRMFEAVDKAFLDPDMLKEFTRATELMDRMLESATSVTEDQLSVISGAQARAMVKLFNLAWDAAVKRLNELYPEIPMDEITDVFHDGLREAAREIEPPE